MAGAVANGACVVNLDLPNGTAVIADLEIPDRASIACV
jgi:hypothetical protein